MYGRLCIGTAVASNAPGRPRNGHPQTRTAADKNGRSEVMEDTLFPTARRNHSGTRSGTTSGHALSVNEAR
jgi:hypothetical protein